MISAPTGGFDRDQRLVPDLGRIARVIRSWFTVASPSIT
jgi:hypothetical protein